MLSGAHAAAASSTRLCADGGGASCNQDCPTSQTSPKSPNSTTHSQNSNAGKSPSRADNSRLQMSSDVITSESVSDPAQSTSTQAVRKVGRRYYSSSESECIPSGNAVLGHGPIFTQRKRSRNQHNNPRGKKRKMTQTGVPLQSSSAQASEASYGAGVKPKVLPRVSATQQPKAPYNTTEFLIADREERESSDRDLADASVSGELSRLRPRCYSSVAGHTSHNAGTLDPYLNYSESSDEEVPEEEDPEFDAIYDNATLERIEGLSRDQVNREMLSVNKSNSLLIDKIGHLKTENHRLKHLLVQHGIDFGKHIGSSSDDIPALLSNKPPLADGTSRSSVENDRDTEIKEKVS